MGEYKIAEGEGVVTVTLAAGQELIVRQSDDMKSAIIFEGWWLGDQGIEPTREDPTKFHPAVRAALIIALAVAAWALVIIAVKEIFQ
jgi:hypothetical protein